MQKNDFPSDKKGAPNESIKINQPNTYTLITLFLSFSRREKKRVTSGAVG
jgi:hypothetical protein